MKTIAERLSMTEDEETKRGELLAEVLQLKKKRSNGRYDTEWGDKTALGLFRTIALIVLDGAK